MFVWLFGCLVGCLVGWLVGGWVGVCGLCNTYQLCVIAQKHMNNNNNDNSTTTMQQQEQQLLEDDSNHSKQDYADQSLLSSPNCSNDNVLISQLLDDSISVGSITSAATT